MSKITSTEQTAATEEQTPAASGKVLNKGGFKFKKLAAITRQHIKMEADKPLYIKITAPMVQTEKHIKDKSDKEAPIVADCTNLLTGEESQIICPEVLKSELNKHFPENAYINKCFEITKFEKESGKQYSKFTIVLIEPE